MLILIGPSASGKTEVAKLLASKYQIKKVITYTTREQRVSEVNGVDYNFISLERFATLSESAFFIESTYYNGNYYGTAKSDVSDDRCIILDPNGFKSFLSLNDDHIVSIFLSCDEEERMHRMLLRGDSITSAKSRIINDRIAFNDRNIQGITFVVDSDKCELNELADEVYNLYSSVINNKKL